MILVDTSVIVAWLDRTHEDHAACTKALEHWAGQDQLGVSARYQLRGGDGVAGLASSRTNFEKSSRLLSGSRADSSWYLNGLRKPIPAAL